MKLKPELVAFALGFGVFLSFVGSAVVAPPDPFTQLLIIPALLVVTVPVIYHVLDVDSVASFDQTSRLPFPYLVGATVASTGAGLFVPVPATTGWIPILVRGGAFAGAFFAVSILAVRIGRDGAAEPATDDQPDLLGGDGQDFDDSDGGISTGSGSGGPGEGPGSDGPDGGVGADGETGDGEDAADSEGEPAETPTPGP